MERTERMVTNGGITQERVREKKKGKKPLYKSHVPTLKVQRARERFIYIQGVREAQIMALLILEDSREAGRYQVFVETAEKHVSC